MELIHSAVNNFGDLVDKRHNFRLQHFRGNGEVPNARGGHNALHLERGIRGKQLNSQSGWQKLRKQVKRNVFYGFQDFPGCSGFEHVSMGKPRKYEARASARLDIFILFQS